MFMIPIQSLLKIVPSFTLGMIRSRCRLQASNNQFYYYYPFFPKPTVTGDGTLSAGAGKGIDTGRWHYSHLVSSAWWKWSGACYFIKVIIKAVRFCLINFDFKLLRTIIL